MAVGHVLLKNGSSYPYALLREYLDWGVNVVDIVTPPRRFWADHDNVDGPVEVGLGTSAVKSLLSPAALLGALPVGDNWQAQGRRSLARLQSHFLLCEDPQRRMDAR